MYGVDDAIYIGIAMALAGAAAQQYGQYKSNSDAAKAAANALMLQQKQRDDTTKKITDLAETYTTDATNDDLSAIAEQLSERYQQPVAESQVNRATEQGAQGDVSSDYSSAKASGDAASLASIQRLAQLMGGVNASGRMRLQQGYNYARTAQDIAQAQKFNNMDNNLSQMQIQAAANGRQGWKVGGSALQALGAAVASMGALSAAGAGAAAGTTAAGTAGSASAGAGAGYGLSSSGAIGSGLSTAGGVGSGLKAGGLGLGAMSSAGAGAGNSSLLAALGASSALGGLGKNTYRNSGLAW